MGKKQHAKVNVFMCTVAVLLCATLFSMHLVGGLYAKYTTTSAASDTARVAKFSITQKFLKGDKTLEDIVEAEIKPGTTNDVVLEIENKSEVAVEYTIEVENITNNLPSLEYKLTPVDDEHTTTSTMENGISRSSSVQIPANKTDKYNLQIEWKANKDDENYDLQYIGMVDYISISVTAAQVD